jgi:hypothetical protein
MTTDEAAVDAVLPPPHPAALCRPAAPGGNGTPVAARQQVQRARCGGAAAVRHRPPGARRLAASGGPARTACTPLRGCGASLRVATSPAASTSGCDRRLQRGAGQHEAAFVQLQAAAGQPGRCVAAGGDDRGVAGQPRAAVQVQVPRLRCARNASWKTVMRRRASIAQAALDHRLRVTEQRRRPPVTSATRARSSPCPASRNCSASASSTPAAPATDHHHVQHLLLRQLQQRVEQAHEVLDRAHEQAVLARTGDAVAVHHRAGVEDSTS